jgi:hypothetical protein
VANEVATTFWLWQIAEMAESFRRNHETLMLKAGALKLALGFTAVEILALAAGFSLPVSVGRERLLVRSTSVWGGGFGSLLDPLGFGSSGLGSSGMGSFRIGGGAYLTSGSALMSSVGRVP